PFPGGGVDLGGGGTGKDQPAGGPAAALQAGAARDPAVLAQALEQRPGPSLAEERDRVAVRQDGAALTRDFPAALALPV
ncbi:hypothetical protein OFO11_40870, partial [Escherichia coli]|nr:hypothetical protein [Escherichia coli]